jgi:hypothetical protein
VSNVTDWGSSCSSLGFCGDGATPGSLLFRGTNGVAFNSYNGLWSLPDPAGYSGNYIAIDGDPTYTAPIFQTINGLTSGRTYTLTFDQAAGQQAGLGGATTEYWVVSLGTSTQNSATMNTPSEGFSGWSQQTMSFTAAAASEVLSFAAVGAPAIPPVAIIADVSLTANAPEPATWAMLIVGFAGLGFAGYRQSRAGRRTVAG